MHALKGSIIKVLHINKGSSDISSKIETSKMAWVQNLVNKNNCHIISSNKSNVGTNDPNQVNAVDGFNFEHSLCKYNGITSF